MPFAITIADAQAPDVPLVYVNRAFEIMTGYGRGAVIGRNCRILQGPQTSARDRSALRAAIDNGTDVSVDIVNYRANGETFLNRLQLSPIATADDVTTHFLGIQTEIPADVFFQARVEKLDQSLREMQHRVKNHLSMLLALIRLESSRAGDVQSSLEVLAHRVETLNLLYDELSLRNAHEDQQVGLGSYVARIASTLNMLDGCRDVVVNIETQQFSAPVEVASQTGLLVSELLTNALKHAFVGEEPGQVDVRLWTDDESVHLRVSDTGSGLPADCDWPRKGNLGARIVRDLCRRLEAELEVNSGRGGTDVRVAVPRRVFDAAR